MEGKAAGRLEKELLLPPPATSSSTHENPHRVQELLGIRIQRQNGVQQGHFLLCENVGIDLLHSAAHLHKDAFL